MRTRLTASLATIAVTAATLVGGGAATASAQTLPSFIPQHLIPAHLAPQVEGIVSQVRAALPPEAWAAVGSSEMAYGDVAAFGVTGGLREGIIREIDAYRIAHGRGALAPNADLDREAQAWADRLAARDEVIHNTALINRGHGENIVAAGTHCGAICLVDLWKNSPGHNENLLDPGYRSAGMGIAYSGNGKVFVVHNFAY
ncbi:MULTISPECIES: CAP domain-containing protein [Dietzia]|uniref:CAP domain-containing protein n=1 Tax=Dietzia cinnamea TaxID=321318 RepID=A0AAW5QCB6_9ACTN|nr:MULTISPECIES: CAP domain-containing protein [Dietzia]KZO59247.1 serine protease [Dietzia maris]MBM7230913.1 CAP domain-containing protein [Dietzia cinnamea]MCT1640456.1 CAP domain-containing protein [Dietzia cinnamea]MCT1864954.1 CAP domain-containing protein [Dietzia cinnamea]MCT2030898.1 CAP domain-containing protein [Dietzia cinnamea]